jgi:hypothetical protein
MKEIIKRIIDILPKDKYIYIYNIEVPISADDTNKILDKCKELNLEFVNLVYWYSGEIETPSFDKKYNDLFYIGEFNLD